MPKFIFILVLLAASVNTFADTKMDCIKALTSEDGLYRNQREDRQYKHSFFNGLMKDNIFVMVWKYIPDSSGRLKTFSYIYTAKSIYRCEATLSDSYKSNFVFKYDSDSIDVTFLKSRQSEDVQLTLPIKKQENTKIINCSADKNDKTQKYQEKYIEVALARANSNQFLNGLRTKDSFKSNVQKSCNAFNRVNNKSIIETTTNKKLVPAAQ